MDRREFLGTVGILTAGTAGAYALPLLTAGQSSTAGAGDASTPSEGGASEKGVSWGMVIDLNQCRKSPEGCTACLVACRKENNVALHGDKRWDICLIRKVKVKREHPAFPSGGDENPLPNGHAVKPVLLLCNHCDHPPCARACPVRATYKRPDGIVIVDQHRCIGCRYCMIACPYNARFFNYREGEKWPNRRQPRSVHGVPQSCTFCAHRLDDESLDEADRVPACVKACPQKALALVNLNEPEVAAWIAQSSARGIREDLGTKPKVFYIGL